MYVYQKFVSHQLKISSKSFEADKPVTMNHEAQIKLCDAKVTVNNIEDYTENTFH